MSNVTPDRKNFACNGINNLGNKYGKRTKLSVGTLSRAGSVLELSGEKQTEGSFNSVFTSSA